MGKKPQRHSWPEAKKLCRLNQFDIEMAKRLGFGPDALIRAIPDPKQRWKLPVKLWVRDLHLERFGEVLGEKPEEPKEPEPPMSLEEFEEAVRRYGEQLYWEDYHERNADSIGTNIRMNARRRPSVPSPVDPSWRPEAVDPSDDDVPF